MQILRLSRHGERIRDFEVGDRPVAVGSSPACDVVVSGPGVAPHEALLVERGGDVTVVPLGRGHGPWTLGDGAWSLGDFDIRPRGAWEGGARGDCDLEDDSPVSGVVTDVLAVPEMRAPRLALVVGQFADARRYPLDGRPLTVGTDPANDVVLHDRAVSRFHVRFEPMARGVVVRDLGSRNGTWNEGLRVGRAVVELGAQIRVGRTLLRLVPVGAVVSGRRDADAFIVASPCMASLMLDAARVARVDWPVLVTGPSGAGKEGVARAIHDQSARKKGPFVAVNAGAIAESLVESEFFGHVRGAFTGAQDSKRGFFAQADGGTLFIDEVAELPLGLQTRLLRVLETWKVRPVGSEQETKVDVRIVAATHRDLRERVRVNAFREDLFFRLVRAVLRVPPLKERPEDVRALVDHFLLLVGEELGPRRLTEDAFEVLLSYPWPGNVRELRNVVSTLALEAHGPTMGAAEVFGVIEKLSAEPQLLRGEDHMMAVLGRHEGNVSAAARVLGVPRSTLRDRVRAAQQEGGNGDASRRSVGCEVEHTGRVPGTPEGSPPSSGELSHIAFQTR